MEPIEYDSLLNISAVETHTGLSASMIHAAVKLGSFPPPLQFDGDEVWPSSDIADWLEGCLSNLPYANWEIAS